MKSLVIFLMFLLSTNLFFSQSRISGIVLNENQIPLPTVLVVNINSDVRTYTNENGHFEINASAGNELRFIRENYDRVALKINSWDFSFPLNVTMIYVPTEIEEVVIGFQPSGNLAKDSKKLEKPDKLAILNKEIGLPKNPEKPREVPSNLVRNVLLPIIGGKLDVQAIYNLASGKARRQKRLYKYDDFQEKIAWIRSNLNPDFFNENQIPNNQISDFLGFAIRNDNTILQGIKQKNIDKISLALIEIAPKYLQRKSKK